MKIAHLNYSANRGGAAIATKRICECLISGGLEVALFANHSTDIKHYYDLPNKWGKIKSILKTYIARKSIDLSYVGTEETTYSANLFRSNIVDRVIEYNPDIVHLHWIAAEFMQIEEIKNLPTKKIIWTMHDMWPFCGAEHYSENNRYLVGYTSNTRSNDERRIDINKWVWKRKIKHLPHDRINYVAPSKWLAEKASMSKICQELPISIIPNPIDTDTWKPLKKEYARQLFSFRNDKKYILFGADGDHSSYRKGQDLLLKALNSISCTKDIILVVFGMDSEYGLSRYKLETKIETISVGRLFDIYSMIALYSAVDVMVVPSRLEAFGQTALEATACGIPVVAFNNTGVEDIIEHGVTGYLCNYLNIEELANGINWALECNYSESENITNRKNLENKFSYRAVFKMYNKIYEQ